MISKFSTCLRWGGACVFIVLIATVPVARGQSPRQLGPAPPTVGPSVPNKPAVTADPMAVPGFWDPRRRPERPDLSRITIIRFLTETDYPPFNYAGPDGNPAGFNIDLARMICEEIKVQCTVQMRRFDTLISALNSNNGDAIIASIAQTPEMRARVSISVILITARRRASLRCATARSTASARKRSRAKKSRSLPAPRTKPTSRPYSQRPSCVLTLTPTLRASR